ncbi:hypothetical protein D187_000232 [Cystobacter fuscus DSM 2262]|uniref:Uncharacterized protein n=1 Tax=Cystobacter fuscus (strain ATCC 25194 / DSM 2262 / NBRC 100088 / M29) TaxID=1242864 RepID=S9PKM8_CYSF2|nr:hypothetical protein D187_000232 [Cystobacter fuscus DSM 2262]
MWSHVVPQVTRPFRGGERGTEKVSNTSYTTEKVSNTSYWW